MKGDGPDIKEELLEDFFAEADEHLTALRETLAQLEPSVGRTKPEIKHSEELFRRFHSFKGICGLVGLRAAENLAHKIEDVLHGLRGTAGIPSFSSAGLDLLNRSVKTLEQIVRAFQEKQPPPEHNSLLRELAAIAESSNAPASGGTPEAKPASNAGPPPLQESSPEVPGGAGELLWRFTFVPSRDLDARGININSVRRRLAGCGEVVKATPLVRGKGQVAFEFLVAMRETPADIAVWEKDGIRAELVESQDDAAIDGAPESSNAEQQAAHSPFLSPSHFVRVDLARLDELMRITGEMVIHRSALDQHLTEVSRKKALPNLDLLEEIDTSFARSLRSLREAVMRVRLVPVAEVFARMPFIVRDLSRETNKLVRLELQGQQTELDKYLVEQLKEPLLHLVRNAFAHAIESPEERTASGKPAEATIVLRAATIGDSVIIEVRDDGCGIDEKAVRSRAAKLGMKLPKTLDDAALLELISAPGFSTKDDPDTAAGRGVGMSVVSANIRDLGGSISLQTSPGKGTSFTLRLPLTLAVADALIISGAGQTCAIPQNFVSEVMSMEEKDVHFVNRNEVISYRSAVLPIIRLSRIFKSPATPPEKSVVLVLTSDRGSVGLVADEIHGQKEVVVRSLRDPLLQVPGLAGVTELGNGKPVLILDGIHLTGGAARPAAREGRGKRNSTNSEASIKQ